MAIVTDPQFYSCIRYDITTPVIYVGYAPIGSEPDDIVWNIKRILFDANGNPTITQWSDNSVRWDDRTIIPYS